MSVNNVVAEVSKVIKGKEKIIEKVLVAILAEGHILLEDVPGIGKTTLALAFSKAMNLDFSRIQFTPDVTASDVVGFTYYDKSKEQFSYRKGAVLNNFVLGDEINRTSSRTQSALLEVMEEGAVTVDGTRYEVPKPFIVMATQNPSGTLGTQSLPHAQLDRFMMQLTMGYPDFVSQMELLRDRQIVQPLDYVQAVITKEELVKIQSEVRAVNLSEELLKYITHLTIATRNHPEIAVGISPRGALALCRAAKARAYMQQRNYVIPEDVMELFIDCTHHRIMLEAHLSSSSREILQELILNTTSPDLVKG
ncbi:MAG: MoxR family ATPase [Kurthia sp.]|nr:MoxR family ATPase [Candidatus Kurthia equi]